KLLKRQIKDYAKTNRTQAEKFEEMLQAVIDQYHKRNLRIVQESAGGAVEAIADLVNDRVIDLTDQLKDIFVQLQKDKTEFVKLGITFEEKAFYDILVDIRNKNGFTYPDDKCIELAKKIKGLIDSTSIYADWLNNNAIKNKLQYDLTILLYNEKYPPEWDEQIFQRVLAQVENYKTYNNE
ncbi:MAG: type I restriction enzyme endonuclease domain-containing protein, partial [Paludibacteraceae bacterium]